MPYLIPGVSVQPLLQALLIKRMANQTNGPGQHKEAVQVAYLHDVLDLSLHVHKNAGRNVTGVCTQSYSACVSPLSSVQ